MAPNLFAFLGQPLRLGELQTAGQLTVAPLFGGSAPLRLLSLEQALDHGAAADEMPTPEVGRIVIRNPTPHALVLLDGEEVLGAQQNRIVDGTVIVAAGAVRTVHVCCVEQKRWEHARRDEGFRTSSQVTSPTLRGVKSRTARGTGRGDQTAVWEQIDRTIMETATASATRAMTDVFERHGATLDRTVSRFRLEEGQVGMMVGVGDRVWGVDVVCDPEAFASAFPRLLRGYAMDALRTLGPAAVSRAEMEVVLARLLERPTVKVNETASERTLRFDGAGLPVEGTATLHGDEVVAVSAILPGAPQGDVAVEERRARSSETDPLRVSWLRSPAGELGITMAPGKRGPSKSGRRWARDVELDLARLKGQHRVDALVCLLTDAELARFGVEGYARRVEARGMRFHRLPIAEGRTPRSIDDVRRLVAALRDALMRHERVVLHCGGGLGRSGTIAGCVLVELGLSADEALEALRARHPGACPESEAQRDFVRGFSTVRAIA